MPNNYNIRYPKFNRPANGVVPFRPSNTYPGPYGGMISHQRRATPSHPVSYVYGTVPPSALPGNNDAALITGLSGNYRVPQAGSSLNYKPLPPRRACAPPITIPSYLGSCSSVGDYNNADSDSDDEDYMDPSTVAWRDVDKGVEIFQNEGLVSLVNKLTDYGIKDYQSALSAATIARLVLKRLHFQGIHRSPELKNCIRFEAIQRFKDYWKLDGGWKLDRFRQLEHPYLTLKGVNLAGFVGSLFRADIVSGDDVHLCLELLAMDQVHFYRLCAIHALIVHCGNKLYKRIAWPGTRRFLQHISVILNQTCQYTWGYYDVGRILLQDILDIADRWFATQELKQVRASFDPRKKEINRD